METQHDVAIRYIRDKLDQLLTVMGTQPLRTEELDDATLLQLDPLGIVAGSFAQIVAHLNETNYELGVARNAIRTVFDSMGAAAVVVDSDLIVRECNRQAREWFFRGVEQEQVLGRRLGDVCICSAEEEAKLLRQHGRERDFVLNGQHYHVVASDLCDQHGTPHRTVFLYFDVTRQRGMEHSLELYARAFGNTAEGILITDAENRILEVNQAFCRITGYSPDELIGNSPNTLRSGLHDSLFYRKLWQQLTRYGHWQGEIFDRTRDGSIIPLLQTISEVRDREGRVTNRISVITDLSHLKETQSRLNFLAHHDALTELPNRVLFNDRLSHAIERARREDSALALLFIDLDRFKKINDSLGHHVGDRLLVEVAKRLSTVVREADTVARLGGDEFVVLMENIGSAVDAEFLADRLVRLLRQPFTLDGHHLHIGCSVGITLFPEDGADAVTLLKNADAAMYRVKDTGRDGYFKFCRSLAAAAEQKLAMEGALRDGVRGRELELYFQPIVDLGDRRVMAAEALLRWPQADGSMVPPDAFIPVAEETKLIVPLGRQVIEQAVAQLGHWRRSGIDLDYLSINASASQIYTHDFADHLFRELERCGIEGRRIQVELTENVLMNDLESCRGVLERLRRHGVRIAIDDFGTGYSSLAYLKQLPIDVLKIDRSFVHDLPGNGNACAIARAVIGLADSLGLHAVAEGVETAEQEHYLASVGCHTLQGFRYARPMPAEAFARYLHELPGARAVGSRQ